MPFSPSPPAQKKGPLDRRIYTDYNEREIALLSIIDPTNSSTGSVKPNLTVAIFLCLFWGADITGRSGSLRRFLPACQLNGRSGAAAAPY